MIHNKENNQPMEKDAEMKEMIELADKCFKIAHIHTCSICLIFKSKYKYREIDIKMKQLEILKIKNNQKSKVLNWICSCSQQL